MNDPGHRSWASLLAHSALPRREARRLAALACGRPLEWLIAHDDADVPADEATRFESLAARRLAGEPLAYLGGRSEFFGRAFEVSPAVLVPRIDTETLVEAALERIVPGGLVIDAGTGSGCIAITLACERADLRLWATDRSAAALDVARANAKRLGASIGWLQGHWLDALAPRPIWDAIVSNPPYIACADPHLAQPDLRFEPRSALVSGVDGLDAIRNIVREAPPRLAPNGWLLIEHGWQQGAAVRTLLHEARLVDVQSLRDTAGHERVSLGRKDS